VAKFADLQTAAMLGIAVGFGLAMLAARYARTQPAV
jgi:hypothetical protein